MIEVRQSDEFRKWLKGLRDENAYVRIVQRVRRMERGNPGDVKSIGGGLHEMRIAYGPGYRVYFVYEGSTVVILLCGGDKDTQASDIKRARALAGK
jgi:putative addiction module killer protein